MYYFKQCNKDFSGGEVESKELKTIFINKEFEGWKESSIIKNTKKILSKIALSFESNRSIKELLNKIFGKKILLKSDVSIKKASFRSILDYEELTKNWKLTEYKSSPRGKTFFLMLKLIIQSFPSLQIVQEQLNQFGHILLRVVV